MISSLRIRNFKCFADLHIRFGHLTLLTGFNGGGKSTAIQPLLLLSQNQFQPFSVLNRRPTNYVLNGSLVQLGTIGDVLPNDVLATPIEFIVECEGIDVTWAFSGRAGERFLRCQQQDVDRIGHTRNEIRRSEHLIDKALATLMYISAVRGGVVDAYPSSDEANENFVSVGADGRFAAYCYDRFVDDDVPDERRHPNETAVTFRKQLDAWIGDLFPGAQVNVQALPQVSSLSLQFRLSETGAWKKPANIGYGLTYAFPILVALLAARDGQIVIVDSPEAHLHPSAQSRMGCILAHFAQAGVQIVVESHSDHLLNGVRLAVKDGRLSSDNLQVHFFSGVTSRDHGVMSPAIDRDGKIYEWPEGFFDQSERDLALLTDWN